MKFNLSYCFQTFFFAFLLVVSSVEGYLFFSPEMIRSHLKNYDVRELALIDRDLDVIRGLCFDGLNGEAERPIYLATAGAPGARKSTILERFIATHPEFTNVAYLDPDQRGLKFMVHTYYAQSLSAMATAQHEDYALVRKAAYEKWRGASNYITLTLLEEAFDQRLNIAHGTTNTGGHIPKFFEKLKEAGYAIVLLLCACDDNLRREAIKQRNKVQCFYQSTLEDEIAKGDLFLQKFPHYLTCADTLYLYWSESLSTEETLAAVIDKGTLTILDAEAYTRFMEKMKSER